jgi:hypothetical protein
MAHFAEIDENGRVLRVIVVADSDCGGGVYPQSDPLGAAFCARLLGGTWKQTSYNSNFRQRYAGAGYRFDEELDAFIAPQPYPSWTLDRVGEWQPPVPMPTDGGAWVWDEASGSWVVSAEA